MINLNDQHTRLQLIERFLNAETTLEEECLLREYFSQNTNELTTEEKAVSQLLLLTGNTSLKPEISKEKATEFDLLMKPKSKKNAVLWIASIAAAIIIAFLLFSNQKSDESEGAQIAKVIERNPVLPLKEETKPKETPVVAKTESTHPPVIKRKTARSELPKKTSSAPVKEEKTIDLGEMMAVVNYDLEQIESYEMRPAGNAMIVTKTLANGTSSTYIVATIDKGKEYTLVPINNQQ